MGQKQKAARYLPDGLLVIQDGLISDFGPYAEIAPRHRQAEIIHLPDRLCLPGFIDDQVRFPQVRALGAYGTPPLDGLRISILPEELKYRDRGYAREAVHHFFDALFAGGMTTLSGVYDRQPGLD